MIICASIYAHFLWWKLNWDYLRVNNGSGNRMPSDNKPLSKQLLTMSSLRGNELKELNITFVFMNWYYALKDDLTD